MSRLAKILLMLLMLIVLTSCGNDISKETSLEELPSDFSLQDAKKSGCVVHEDGDITDGEEIWEAFLAKVENREPATVRIADYYTLDEEKCDPEYYESVKDEYPKLYFKDLFYDGESYTIKWFEEGKEYSQTYKYMNKYVEKPASSTATFEYAINYVLVNDETISSYEEIMMSLASSQSGVAIPHHTVYSDYIYKD